MKIAFAEDLTRQDSGKHKFLHRLSKELESRKDVHVVKKHADILLHIGRNIGKIDAKKKVMRVDGLWFNKSDVSTDKKNKSIRKYMEKSDGIVYQGEFCRTAYVDFFGKKFIKSKPHVCIMNGADPSEFLPRNPKNFFFTYANWRPHKRLACIEESFSCAVGRGLDADLIVAGKCEKKNIPRIKYVGWIGHDRIKEYLSECIAVIHLAWLDWNPNCVSESLISGTNIIFSQSGGHTGLVGQSGIPIDDASWQGTILDLYNPPLLNIDQIVKAMFRLYNKPMKVCRPDLYINNIANKYIKFFNSLLE